MRKESGANPSTTRGDPRHREAVPPERQPFNVAGMELLPSRFQENEGRVMVAGATVDPTG